MAKIRTMMDPVTPSGLDAAVDDRRAKPREGPDRRRTARPELSERMKAAARSRAGGICECSNRNCWHFRRCNTPGVAYLDRLSATGVVWCVLFCRECALTWVGRVNRL